MAKLARDDRGFTIAELAVVVLIFSIVMTLISVSFNRIVTSSGQLIKSAETDIGGLIGLEVLRSDLELGGYGLPWSLDTGTHYTETGEGVMVAGRPDTVASSFNDLPPDPPRAYLTGDNVGLNSSDYLVIKGTALGSSPTSRKWSYLKFGPSDSFKESKSETELAPGRGERVIVLRNFSSSSIATERRLVSDSGNFTLRFDPPIGTPFRPRGPEDTFLVFGVAGRARDEKNDHLSYPYNRADYFIGRRSGRDMSSFCAANTGVLYKVVFNHNDGGGVVPSTYYPILDCVADMQVIFFMDTDGDGVVDTHLSRLVNDHTMLPYTAAELREQLKEVRVYILAQQGKKDPTYLYPVDQVPTIVVGDRGLDLRLRKIHGSAWSTDTLTGLDRDWRNYHWKIYTIVVQPKNL